MNAAPSRRQTRPAGFTLIELLAVVAIILILLSILVPTLSGMRLKASRMIDLNNLRQFASATVLAANEANGDIPPGARESAICGVQGDDIVWFNYNSYVTIQKYANDPTKKVFSCICYQSDDATMASFGTVAGWGTSNSPYCSIDGSFIGWTYLAGRITGPSTAYARDGSVITNAYLFPTRLGSRSTSRTLATCWGYLSYIYWGGNLPHLAPNDGARWYPPCGPWDVQGFEGEVMCYIDGSARWVPYSDFGAVWQDRIDFSYFDRTR